MNLSDEDKERFEQELEDTSVKALLIQQNALLSQLVQTMQARTQDEREATVADVWQCNDCGKRVSGDELQTHAVEQHKAPPDMPNKALGEPLEL